ncbi:hypothetical protein OIU77_002894 [Salix suchowensis]|uniref:Exostosin GT47 domain-containing protein n=1 Tax=Salix suchowensis TaxID=1278906 RepID=A0ABQ9AZ18_9ROSI|nr:hypothetical protein OIU77_002894 [Salix suchowensis]
MELDIRTPNLNIALSVLQEQYQNTSFCICPRGTRVDGICLASSIGFGCVPGKAEILNIAEILHYHALAKLQFYTPANSNAKGHSYEYRRVFLQPSCPTTMTCHSVTFLTGIHFSVIVKEDDVSHLKRILKGIPETKFEKMRENVLKVQKHFQWNSVQVKYDAFHMVMYELWMRRHTIRLPYQFEDVHLKPSTQHPQQKHVVTRNKAPRQASAQDSDIFAKLFHTPEDFNVDYMEMEKNFKIFVYPHNTTICDEPRKPDGEYASEGLFFENLYQSRFLTKDPDKAHLFLIPTYCHSLPAEGRSVNERSMAMVDFVMSLISEDPYWNRTLGADHFFVTCSDIHVTATARIVNLMKNSIRVMCSPRYDVEYAPHKDVSLPQKTTLAFWSGQPDSHIRETLINNWGFDPELEIHIGFEASTAEGRWEFHDDLSKSKFCICPGGPQLDGVLAAAINYGCVPVILSDYYDVPFKDILDWKKFSVIIKEIDVYQLKKILAEIPKNGIRSPAHQRNHDHSLYIVFLNSLLVNQVQKHFEWNLPSVRLDAFHMVMYELWMRRRVTKY